MGTQRLWGAESLAGNITAEGEDRYRRKCESHETIGQTKVHLGQSAMTKPVLYC